MSAYEKGLYLLSIREHSKSELREKLLSKGFDEKETEDAIVTLSTEGALSDERYASSFIRSRLRKSPEGRSLLLSRLMMKGVEKETAERALSRVWEEGEYIEPLRKALNKYGKEKMLKKGFRMDEIREAENE